MKHKFVAKLLTSNGIKNRIMESDFDKLDYDKVKGYFVKEYKSNIAILSLEKVIDTTLVSGIYI